MVGGLAHTGHYYRSGTMKIKNTEQLGRAIRTRRKQIKVTQKDLAMTCGTGPRFIIDLEKGKSTCRIGKTLDVLQALGLVVEARALDSERGTGGHHP